MTINLMDVFPKISVGVLTKYLSLSSDVIKEAEVKASGADISIECVAISPASARGVLLCWPGVKNSNMVWQA